MALRFRQVSAVPLCELDVEAPDGCVIGIIGENGSGKGRLLRLAAGIEQPVRGTVEVPAGARFLAAGDPLNLAPAPLVAIEHTFARQDAVVRGRAAVALDRLRRAGSTVLLVSHEEDLLARLADEIWWLESGRLARRGDPLEMLGLYRAHAAARLRAWGETIAPPLDARLRRGDGRAEIVSLQTLGESGNPTMVFRSGEAACVRARIRYREAVPDPVVGIMIRTRTGLHVYGTNTELERLKLGPCAAGCEIEVSFAFACHLCPGEFTLTVASHDPDGVWHDWLEDALAFAVTDSRYTAGVANLRAVVTFACVTSDR